MRNTFLNTLCLILILSSGIGAAAQKKPDAKAEKARTAATKTKPAASKATKAEDEEPQPPDENALKARLDEIRALAVAERVAALEKFLEEAPAESPSRVRAKELLAGARAALGDEQLRSGDPATGLALFRRVVEEVTPETSDKLFAEVVTLLPQNLYALGRADDAAELARLVEEKAAGNARRLVAVAAVYLSADRLADATRAAEAAVAAGPDNAAAHSALALAYARGFRLEDAAREYARAVELDPKNLSWRLSLADLRRATGKPEEAVALYRELLASEAKTLGPQAGAARAGLVLALFDAGKLDEAESELGSALKAHPDHLPLLVGAIYQLTARGEGARAVELAERALEIEKQPWVWTRLAYARALIAQNRPLEAERAAREAALIASFPLVQYELASALAAAGLYDEAAEELSKAYTLRADGRVETLIAGRARASAEDFRELNDLEIQAATMFRRVPDTAENAARLKSLLAFHAATRLGAVDERAATEAGKEFSKGSDEMRAFRQLYVAAKLLERGAAHASVIERTDDAMDGIDAASAAPEAVVALLAEELRPARTTSRATGVSVTIPVIPPDIISKILRGRVEDLAGWSLYHQGNYAEAVVRLKRAASVMPTNSPWWAAVQWHLGAALDASGSSREALVAYVRSYRLAPQEARLPVIQSLYRRLNQGSDAGFERMIRGEGAQAKPEQPFTLSNRSREVEVPAELGVKTETPKPVEEKDAEKSDTKPETKTDEQKADEAKPAEPPVKSEEAKPEEKKTEDIKPEERKPKEGKAEEKKSEEKKPEESKSNETGKEAKPPEPEPSPLPTPTPTATPEPEQKSSQAETQTASATPTPSPEPTPAPTPAAPPANTESSGCISVNEPALSVKASSGSALVVVKLEGVSDPSKLKASTPNWADILIFAEPPTPGEPNTQRYSVSSVSGKPGTYTITFSLPCGKREVLVEVK